MRLRLSSRAIDTLIAHATEGYEIDYKEEVGGHLLGFRDGYGFYVGQAVPYRTRRPFASRTGWGPNSYYFEKKGDRLEKITRLKWIGVYHSHVEVKGKASTKQSGEDKVVHNFSIRPLEIIVRVANFRMRTPKDCLPFDEYYDECDEENEYVSYGEKGYSYDICGYVIDSRKRIKRIKVVKAR